MDHPLVSRIDMTAFVGVLMAVLVVFASMPPKSLRAESLHYSPSVPGKRIEVMPAFAMVVVEDAGPIRVGSTQGKMKLSSDAELLQDVGSIDFDYGKRVAVGAGRDIPYDRFVRVVRRLRAAGYEVTLIGEDMS